MNLYTCHIPTSTTLIQFFYVNSMDIVLYLKPLQGVHKKKFILIWKAIAPLKIIIGTKVGGVSENAGANLSMEYHNFPVAQQGAEIFEFKVDPVLKLTFLNVMSGV